MMGTMKRAEALGGGRRPAACGRAGGGLPAGEFLVIRLAGRPGRPARRRLGAAGGHPAGRRGRARPRLARAGRVKLGVELAAGARIGEKSADRGGYALRLADYEAAVVAGVPAVPQPDGST